MRDPRCLKGAARPGSADISGVKRNKEHAVADV
jgi:hypothetical protein